MPAAAGLLLSLAALPCAATAGEAEGVKVHEGACSMTSAKGETLFAGDCVITRRAETRDVAGERCDYLRYEVLYPGVGLAVVEQGQDIVCPPRFQDRDAEFLAMDKRGRLVVATAEGALLRFDPGALDPEAAPVLPELDDDLAGIEACSFTPDHQAFVQSLWAAFPVTATDPDGLRSLSGGGGEILWPPGNPPPDQPVRSRKTGVVQQIDVPLRGTYLGLAIAALRLETEIGTSAFSETYVFAEPRAAIDRKFGASVRGARKQDPLPGETHKVLPDIAEDDPGRLMCEGEK
ncbi:hypothetical protein C8J30_10645 [Rhodobacter viridis]|uniref:Uncharacterized protein n=2 Tax=Rhodobacter viridis TaxID=1054202 RepID=A0A318U3B8_9RHOB|nr:hypothetical protein C8J30_10645 [Rhodobacter viridis]